MDELKIVEVSDEATSEGITRRFYKTVAEQAKVVPDRTHG